MFYSMQIWISSMQRTACRHSSVCGQNVNNFLMVTNMTHRLGTFDVVTKSEIIRPEATGGSLSKCWPVASVKLPGNDDSPAIVWECCGDMSSRLCSSAARTLSVTGRPSGCPLIWADMLTRPTFSRLIFAEYVPSRLSCNSHVCKSQTQDSKIQPLSGSSHDQRLECMLSNFRVRNLS